MNWQSVSFDWNQARAFLATAETGSLSAAARTLRLTQPTLGRQVAALETHLGVTLFERVGRSLSLSRSGFQLLEHFRSMGEAAAQISLGASGQSQAIEGQVTITAGDAVSAYWLPAVLKRLRVMEPGIEIEVLASNDIRDLRRREADIAIRHVRPDQPDLIARLVRQSTAHLYASTDYLEELGWPTRAEDLSSAAFIGFAPVERLMLGLNAMGLSLTPRNFRIVTDNSAVVLETVKQGLGIAMIPKEFATLIPGIACVLPDLSIPLPFWLVTHAELLTSRRIRVVFDLLAEELSRGSTGDAKP
ncbi:MAG: LysR family transcriptional regulator [bacterium]|nr:LysR family transcriptional regulator [bacterium]